MFRITLVAKLANSPGAYVMNYSPVCILWWKQVTYLVTLRAPYCFQKWLLALWEMCGTTTVTHC